MYQSSNNPVMADQQANQARHGAESDARIQNARRVSSEGRARMFNILVQPDSLVSAMGLSAAVDVAKLQAQTRLSRAVGLLGTGDQIDTTAGPDWQKIIAGAPVEVSLNRFGGACAPYAEVPAPRDTRPGMPRRAPEIVNGPLGTVHIDGEHSSFGYASKPRGLSGYAPPWADASVSERPVNIGANDGGVNSWLTENPWLALSIGVVSVWLLSRRQR